MKLSKWKVITVLILVVGGVFMFFDLNNKEIERQQKRDLETSIAKMLVNDYENVKEIEFLGWGYSHETGAWGTTVVINENNRMSLSFGSLSGLEEIGGSSYHPSTFKLVESENAIEYPRIDERLETISQTSLEGIEIIYSEDFKEKKNGNK
ncbi:hypothetical protein [Streptococcus suis]